MPISSGTARPKNGLSRVKGAKVFGVSHESVPPRLRPPRRRLTGTSVSLPAASREPAKRSSIPPLSTKRAHLSERLAIKSAHIGKDEDRDLLVQQLVDRIRHAAMAVPDLGIRRQGAFDVEDRRQERLRLIGGPAEDEADPAALAALVEKMNGAGRVLAQYFDPRDRIADFGRSIEGGFGLGRIRLES